MTARPILHEDGRLAAIREARERLAGNPVDPTYLIETVEQSLRAYVAASTPSRAQLVALVLKHGFSACSAIDKEPDGYAGRTAAAIADAFRKELRG